MIADMFVGVIRSSFNYLRITPQLIYWRAVSFKRGQSAFEPELAVAMEKLL